MRIKCGIEVQKKEDSTQKKEDNTQKKEMRDSRRNILFFLSRNMFTVHNY